MSNGEWTAPQVERRPEPGPGADRASLEAWLDYHRDTLLLKCAGLTGEQLRRRSVPPSTLSLLGLVRHLAEVERSWFAHGVDRQPRQLIYGTEERPDGDLDDVEQADPAADFATYGAEVARARAAAARHELQDTFQRRTGTTFDLRWVYLHMIEEYARHNGHADLLREAIDGVTGD